MLQTRRTISFRPKFATFKPKLKADEMKRIDQRKVPKTYSSDTILASSSYKDLFLNELYPGVFGAVLTETQYYYRGIGLSSVEDGKSSAMHLEIKVRQLWTSPDCYPYVNDQHLWQPIKNFTEMSERSSYCCSWQQKLWRSSRLLLFRWRGDFFAVVPRCVFFLPLKARWRSEYSGGQGRGTHRLQFEGPNRSTLEGYIIRTL